MASSGRMALSTTDSFSVSLPIWQIAFYRLSTRTPVFRTRESTFDTGCNGTPSMRIPR
jgi:hypothetical protein